MAIFRCCRRFVEVMPVRPDGPFRKEACAPLDGEQRARLSVFYSRSVGIATDREPERLVGLMKLACSDLLGTRRQSAEITRLLEAHLMPGDSGLELLQNAMHR